MYVQRDQIYYRKLVVQYKDQVLFVLFYFEIMLRLELNVFLEQVMFYIEVGFWD